jgi:hypothetical protein
MECLKKSLELINSSNNEKQSSNELQDPQKLIQNLAEKEVLDKQKERQQQEIYRIANSIPNSYSNPEEEEWPDFSSEAKQSCPEPKRLDSGPTVSYRSGGLSDDEDDEDCGECDRREIPK